MKLPSQGLGTVDLAGMDDADRELISTILKRLIREMDDQEDGILKGPPIETVTIPSDLFFALVPDEIKFPMTRRLSRKGDLYDGSEPQIITRERDHETPMSGDNNELARRCAGADD